MSPTVMDNFKFRFVATDNFKLMARKTEVEPSLNTGCKNAVVDTAVFGGLELEYLMRPDGSVLRELSVTRVIWHW